MIVESVRTILGAELTKQIEAALKGKGKDGADIDVVVGNDGSFVSAESHNLVVEQHSQAEKTLTAVTTTLKDLGGSGDSKNLAADVLKAKADMEALQSTHKGEMAKLNKLTAVKLGLGPQVHDPDDVISKLNLDDIELDENGKIKGNKLDELIKPIKESKPYLFKAQEKPKVKGAEPGVLDSGSGADGEITTLTDAIQDTLYGDN